jgi:hypothetical protein
MNAFTAVTTRSAPVIPELLLLGTSFYFCSLKLLTAPCLEKTLMSASERLFLAKINGGAQSLLAELAP